MSWSLGMEGEVYKRGIAPYINTVGLKRDRFTRHDPARNGNADGNMGYLWYAIC